MQGAGLTTRNSSVSFLRTLWHTRDEPQLVRAVSYKLVVRIPVKTDHAQWHWYFVVAPSSMWSCPTTVSLKGIKKVQISDKYGPGWELNYQPQDWWRMFWPPISDFQTEQQQQQMLHKGTHHFKRSQRSHERWWESPGLRKRVHSCLQHRQHALEPRVTEHQPPEDRGTLCYMIIKH